MPFQSEKQRKYLWANEPEIARDWTDKYGSRVKKQLGGILDIGYHGSPWYQDILSQGFKGGSGQSSRILGMNMPTWAGKGKTFVASNPSAAYRYGVPIEVAKSARNFTIPFGGGLDKRGISFAKETALNPKQATKGMNLMQKLRAGQYLNSPTAQRLLQTGTTAASRLGILEALSSLGGQAVSGLPLAYTYGASKLQESLPMSLIGQGGLSDQNPYFGAMGVSVDPTVEETLRYGDDGKPSPDTGEGSTLAKAWNAIKNEFGGSAEAATLGNLIRPRSQASQAPQIRDRWNIKYGTDETLAKYGDQGWVGGPLKEYDPKLDLNKAYRLGMNEYLKRNKPISYSETDIIPSEHPYANMIKTIPYKGSRFSIKDIKNIGLNQDEDDPYLDPNRIPGRIQKSVPRKMGMLERFRNRFYKPATRPAGGYGVAQLNRMNALGGHYSEPAREQRRQRSRVSNMLARQAAGKSYSQKNLNQLTMGSRPGHYDRPGGNGGVQGTSTPATPGGWHPGAAKGGLATLWPR